MSDPVDQAILDHYAGATVEHAGPFSTLEVPSRDELPSPEFVERWVRPFYMAHPPDAKFAAAFAKVSQDVDEELVRELLSFRNWRPRIVGAYFAAIKEMAAVLDVIGPLLLRSDACYAGRGYCLALARINTPPVVDTLEQYLDYYLTRTDLYFDQAAALAALHHLDSVNGTSRAKKYDQPWRKFIADKPHWDLDRSKAWFGLNLRALERLAEGKAR